MFKGVGIGMCREMEGNDSSVGKIILQLVRKDEVSWKLGRKTNTPKISSGA